MKTNKNINAIADLLADEMGQLADVFVGRLDGEMSARFYGVWEKLEAAVDATIADLLGDEMGGLADLLVGRLDNEMTAKFYGVWEKLEVALDAE